MRRLTRRAAWLLTLATLGTVMQLGVSPVASAATTCRHYDGFRTDGGAIRRNVRVCAAPAADFPTYSGWGRLLTNYSVTPSPCTFSILPFDVDDPNPGYSCAMMLPAPVAAWRWTGSGWKSLGEESPLRPGTRAYLAPYANGWRWAWTEQTGWVAVQEQHAAFRWYAS